MLFISPHPGYLLTGIKQPRDIYHPSSGQYLDTEPGIDAEFVHGGAPTWAADQALANPTFQTLWGGLPDGVDRRTYISSFDTEKKQAEKGWSDETRRDVEQFLISHPDFGTRYVIAEQPVEPSPWPAYGTTHHSQIVKVAKEIGVPLDKVLAYEIANKNRHSVVSALEAELVPAEQPVAA